MGPQGLALPTFNWIGACAEIAKLSTGDGVADRRDENGVAVRSAGSGEGVRRVRDDDEVAGTEEDGGGPAGVEEEGKRGFFPIGVVEEELWGDWSVD